MPPQERSTGVYEGCLKDVGDNEVVELDHGFSKSGGNFSFRQRLNSREIEHLERRLREFSLSYSSSTPLPWYILHDPPSSSNR